MTYTSERAATGKSCLWGAEYVIDNLPPWIYSDNVPPASVQECKAKVSALEYTIKDIELQIEIRELNCIRATAGINPVLITKSGRSRLYGPNKPITTY